MINKLKTKLHLLIVGILLIVSTSAYSQNHIFEFSGFFPTKDKIFGDGYQTGYIKQYDFEFNYYFNLFQLKKSKILAGVSVNLAPEKLLVRYNSDFSFNSSLSIDDYKSIGIGIYYNTTIIRLPYSHIDFIVGINTNHVLKSVDYLTLFSLKNAADTIGFQIGTNYYESSHLRNSIEAELIYYFKLKKSNRSFVGIGLKSKYIFNTMREVEYSTSVNYKSVIYGTKKYDFFSFGTSLLWQF